MIINARIKLLARSNYAGRSGKTFFTRSLQKRPWRALTWIRAFLLFSNMNQRVLYAFFTARANGAYYLDSHICFRFAFRGAHYLDSRIASISNLNQQVLYAFFTVRVHGAHYLDSRISSIPVRLADPGKHSLQNAFMARINLDSRISSISNLKVRDREQKQ